MNNLEQGEPLFSFGYAFIIAASTPAPPALMLAALGIYVMLLYGLVTFVLSRRGEPQ